MFEPPTVEKLLNIEQYFIELFFIKIQISMNRGNWAAGS
jgi:hypothetical protein